MRKNLVFLSFCALLAISVQANAAVVTEITPTTGIGSPTYQWSGNQTSQTAIDLIINPIISPATELYKRNADDDFDTGLLANSYQTTFNADRSGGSIEYKGGPYVGPTAWLLVKDGNQEPAWYLFNLTGLGWDGQNTLALSDFWPKQGEISHVALYGSAVPIPAAAWLLGSGLMGLVVIRRRSKK